MLPRLFELLDAGQPVGIRRFSAGRDVSASGAFPVGTVLTFDASVPRQYGFAGTVLRITPDGGESVDFPFSFVGTDAVTDRYRLKLDTVMLPGGGECGLYFYEYLFPRGWDTRFSNTEDNVNFKLAPHSAEKFRLLLYDRDFRTPDWFRGGVLYQIFPDRFFRGTGETVLRSGATLNPDWEHGIPQYAQAPGDPLPNNVFFGGNLWGITQKLDVLQTLGVTALYLSPVFESSSNHRYDTGDYEKIDSLLGGEQAFDGLISEAHKRGIRVILDGVFNHTGDDSRYFNRRGRYPEVGAYQSERSPYADWYRFRHFPDDYECWWNIPVLPRLNHANIACRRYFTGTDGIAAKWLRRGADGWRLDVADELSDGFLEEFRQTVKKETEGKGLIIGEVWENAAEKTAYGKRRRYLTGRQLDSVMNYPFRQAVLAFLLDGDAKAFRSTLTRIYASYPRQVSDCLMNLIGTHDTERILTVLGGAEPEKKTNAELAVLRLTPEQRTRGICLLKIASALQFTVYGVPSVYYGDEAGLEGGRDPFCRMPYPWGQEDADLLAHYRALGRLRREHPALKDGEFRFLRGDASSFVYERATSNDRVLTFANRGKDARVYPLTRVWFDWFEERTVSGMLTVPPDGFVILVPAVENGEQ